jgi:imidazolonepropionase-like amidohydrolase
MFSNPVTPKIFHMLVRQYARIELMSGVTTIRTVGGLRDLDSRVRDEIYSGKQIGPRILTSNEGISVPGGHMAGSVAAIAKNTDEAVQLVQKGKRQGVEISSS